MKGYKKKKLRAVKLKFSLSVEDKSSHGVLSHPISNILPGPVSQQRTNPVCFGLKWIFAVVEEVEIRPSRLVYRVSAITAMLMETTITKVTIIITRKVEAVAIEAVAVAGAIEAEVVVVVDEEAAIIMKAMCK
jgi:hypothetical protein